MLSLRQPVLPVAERPVPQGGVPGEVLSPTQPFPADLPPLGPDRITPDEAWGLTSVGSRRIRPGDILGAQ